MATSGKVLGTNINVYLNDDPDGSGVRTLIACATSSTLSISRAVIEAFCKGDGSEYDAIPGRKNYSMSVEGLVIYDNDVNVEEFFDIIDNGTEVEVEFTTNVNGDINLKSRALITSFEFTAAIDEVATYSCEFTLIKGITKSTIAGS